MSKWTYKILGAVLSVGILLSSTGMAVSAQEIGEDIVLEEQSLVDQESYDNDVYFNEADELGSSDEYFDIDDQPDCKIFDEYHHSYTPTNNAKVNKILEFAYSKIHSTDYCKFGSNGEKQAFCQAFVKDCYKNAGIIIYDNPENANEAKHRWRVSDDFNIIPVGACVYFKDYAGNGNGHVALYTGNGRMVHVVSGVHDRNDPVSYVDETSIDYYLKEGIAECWGYQAGYDLYAEEECFSDISARSITSQGAIIEVALTSSVAPEKYGAYIYTDETGANEKKITLYNLSSINKISLDTRKLIGNLAPNTTYYYKFYYVLDNSEKSSELSSFTTLDKDEPDSPAINRIYTKGDKIRFGHRYYGDADTILITKEVSEALEKCERGYYKINGKLYYTNGKGNSWPTIPINWIVLDEDQDSILVISEYALEGASFSSDINAGEVTWINSEVRRYLNSDKYLNSCFLPEERAEIMWTQVDSERASTEDRVFLPSIEEIEKYLVGTDYLNAKYLTGMVPDVTTPITGFSDAIAFDKKNYTCAYWTRSSNRKNYGWSQPSYVGCDGEIRAGGRVYYTWSSGLRPMMRIRKSSLSIQDPVNQIVSPFGDQPVVVEEGENILPISQEFLSIPYPVYGVINSTYSSSGFVPGNKANFYMGKRKVVLRVEGFSSKQLTYETDVIAVPKKEQVIAYCENEGICSIKVEWHRDYYASDSHGEYGYEIYRSVNGGEYKRVFRGILESEWDYEKKDLKYIYNDEDVVIGKKYSYKVKGMFYSSTEEDKMSDNLEGYSGEFSEPAEAIAKEREPRVTISFDANGGHGSKIDDLIVKKGAEAVIPKCSFYRTDYEFESWNTKKDGSGETYKELSKFVNNYNSDKSIILYAQWREIEYVSDPEIGGDIDIYQPIAKNTKLTLVSETEGAKIYYTTDPEVGYDISDENGILFKDYILITEDVTIFARAYKEGYYPSWVSEFEIEVSQESDEPEDEEDYEVEFINKPQRMVVGIPEEIGISVTPSSLDQEIMWESSDEDVLTIEDHGMAATAIPVSEGVVEISATVTGKNGSGTAYMTVTVIKNEAADNGDEPTEDTKDSKDRHEIWIGNLDDSGYTYTGSEIQPDIRVYDDVTLLTEGIDYTLSYKNNVVANQLNLPAEKKKAPSLTVKMIGNYTGTITETFKINPLELSEALSEEPSFKADDMYLQAKKTKKGVYTAQKLKPVIWYEGKELIQNKDFSLEQNGNISEPGEYELRVNAKSKNFSGSFALKAVVYEVSEDVEYKSLEDKKVKVVLEAKKVALGEANKLTVSAADGKILTEGVEYTATLVGDDEIGKATYVISGNPQNGYIGQRTVSYNVLAIPVTDFIVEVDEAVIAKGGAKPKVRVYSNITKMEELKEGVDYKVKYSSNTSVSKSGIVKIIGIGKYNGTRTEKFSIRKQSISSLSVAVEDVAFSKSANAYKKAKIQVRDMDGKLLKKGLDYDVNMTPVDGNKTPEVGSYVQAHIVGKGNYNSGVIAYFNITDPSTNISKAKIAFFDEEGQQVKSFRYTGYEIEPKIITLTIGSGKNAKILDKSAYEIVGYSNNVNKGKATITVRGINGYGGLVDYSFAIGNKTAFN